MLIKITVEKGVVVDVKTTEPALVQIVDVNNSDETSTFETVTQTVALDLMSLTIPLRIHCSTMR